jgi:hypothetical protein
VPCIGRLTVLTKADWKPDASKNSVKDWLSAASIVVDYDPDLDLTAKLKKLEKRAVKAAKRAKGKENDN